MKNNEIKTKKKFSKILLSIMMILIGVIYILNPTFGMLELIPDNIPFIGNLDEAGAVFLIISGLRYLGFDLTKFFKS